MNLSTLADGGNSATLNGVGEDAGKLAKQALSVTGGIAAGNTTYGLITDKLGNTKGAVGVAKKAGAALLSVFVGLAVNKLGSKLLKTDQL